MTHKHIKPKQVGEQHKMLSSPEHNFRPKKIAVRVHELEEELAEQERLEYLAKGVVDDTD